MSSLPPCPAFHHARFACCKLKQKRGLVSLSSDRRKHSEGGGWERKSIKKAVFSAWMQALRTSLPFPQFVS